MVSIQFYPLSNCLSEKLASTERHLDVSKGHSQRATDKTDELKQLNRSIFRPVITFNKDAKRAAREAEIQNRYEEDRLERERAMKDIRDTQNRLGRAATYGRSDEEGISGRGRTTAELNARKEQRQRYQFETNASDDELEDELDDNLDEIGDATKRLKALAMGMNQELDTQNNRIERITDKTIALDTKVLMNTDRVCTFSVQRSDTDEILRIFSSRKLSRGGLLAGEFFRLLSYVVWLSGLFT